MHNGILLPGHSEARLDSRRGINLIGLSSEGTCVLPEGTELIGFRSTGIHNHEMTLSLPHSSIRSRKTEFSVVVVKNHGGATHCEVERQFLASAPIDGGNGTALLFAREAMT